MVSYVRMDMCDLGLIRCLVELRSWSIGLRMWILGWRTVIVERLVRLCESLRMMLRTSRSTIVSSLMIVALASVLRSILT